MVHFYDITFDEDWIYAAEAYDVDFEARGTVKFNRHTEELYTDCTSDNMFKKGMFHVQRDIERGRLGQHSNRTVVWY